MSSGDGDNGSPTNCAHPGKDDGSALFPWRMLRYELCLVYKAYGGRKNFLHSPYLQIACILALLVTSFGYLCQEDWKWYEMPLSALPDIVGFSLAAYAIVLTFGSVKFQDAIRGSEEKNKFSPYIKLSAGLAHFVLAQIIALIFAAVGEAADASFFLIAFIGTWLFLYSLCLGVASTLSVFFLSRMYDGMPKE